MNFLQVENKKYIVFCLANKKSVACAVAKTLVEQGGEVIHVEDIAEVALVDAEPTYLGLFNGERSVFIAVEQRESSNIFDVMDGLKLVLAQHSRELPDNMTTEVIFDQSASVEKQVNGFFQNLLQGLLFLKENQRHDLTL